jgi:hypothetical protein
MTAIAVVVLSEGRLAQKQRQDGQDARFHCTLQSGGNTPYNAARDDALTCFTNYYDRAAQAPAGQPG